MKNSWYGKPVVSRKIWGPINFVSNKIMAPELKNLGPGKYWVPKTFGSERKILSQKILGTYKF